MNPFVIRKAAEIADWKVQRWPLTLALAFLAESTIDLRAALQLAADFLRVVYVEPLLPETQDAITVKTLEHVAVRPNGLAGIKGLRQALPRIFGLNVLGLQRATQAINGWLQLK